VGGGGGGSLGRRNRNMYQIHMRIRDSRQEWTVDGNRLIVSITYEHEDCKRVFQDLATFGRWH